MIVTVQKRNKFLSFGAKWSMVYTYLQLSENWVVLNAGEEHSHSVGAVVQVRDASPVQITGQLINVGLQLCKGWRRRESI